jgi:DNA ligase-1
MSAEARFKFKDNNLESVGMTYFNTKEEHLNNTKQFVVLPTWVQIDSYEDAIIHRNQFIDLGFEGLILRNPNAEYQFGKRNQAMFKFKKVDDGKFIIIDITSEHKRSDLPLFVCRNDINDELFECSINKPQDIQREILANKEKFIGKYATIEFRARSGVNQVPFHARMIDIID